MPAKPHQSRIVISIHAPREGCDLLVKWVVPTIRLISIHAPREGCDKRLVLILLSPGVISIHAPREGCDSIAMWSARHGTYFNPRTP